MLVVDASVLVVALVDDGHDGQAARARLRTEALLAPEILDLEVLSVVRRAHRAGALTEQRAVMVMRDLQALPLRRAPHRPLLGRCWELRDTVSVYDAAYVALAEATEATLLTGDGRLARAAGPVCAVELLESQSA